MKQHANWSSRYTFILAAVGSAVGLGNIWKFPYMVGENGGGAFVLVYLIALVVIAAPVLIAEIIVGRHAQRNPVDAMGLVAEKSGASKRWQFFGIWGMVAAFLIMSFYSVIAGWILAYLPKTAMGELTGLDVLGVEQVFNELLSSPLKIAAWQGIFIFATGCIVIRGVNKGIEQAVTFLMPALFVMLTIFTIYSISVGDFTAAAKFLLTPDFSKLTPVGIMAGVGQALFSLSVGFGAMMAYGAYVPKEANIPRSAIIIAVADTLVALAAGFAIFPIVFANGLDPSSGPGLIFVSLSVSFAQMPFGALFGTLFFLLLTFAALTTSIGFIEPIVAWAEEKKNISRPKSVSVLCMGLWLMGLVTVFSFNIWSDVYVLGQFETFAEKTPFDLIDYLITNVMQPLGALMLVVFVGWKMSNSIKQNELELGMGRDSLLYKAWLFAVKFLAPLIIVILFVMGFI